MELESTITNTITSPTSTGPLTVTASGANFPDEETPAHENQGGGGSRKITPNQIPEQTIPESQVGKFDFRNR